MKPSKPEFVEQVKLATQRFEGVEQPRVIAHVVSVSREAFVEIMSALPPASRFVNVEQWDFNHFWLYDPTGDVVIFTPEPIETLPSFKVEGIS